MKPSTRILGIALAGSLALPGVASAGITLGTPHPLCIFWGSFSACASVTVAVDQVTVTVANLSPTTAGNTNYQLTGFGFYFYPSAAAGALTDGTMPTGWAWDQDGALNGVLAGETWIGGASTTQGVNNAIGPDGNKVFVFTLATAPNWDNVYFGWRGQAWKDLAGGDVGSTSIKCFETGEASSQGGDIQAYCGPATVVPEPASMLLLATGLVGMAGAGVIRRRKSRQS